jgi:hypothetical protein
MFARAVTIYRRLLGGKPQCDSADAGQAVEEDRRVWVRHPANLETTCQPAADPDGNRFPARVRNISLGGISLLVNRRFDTGELLSVELPGPAEGSTYTVLACVVHASQQAENDWVLGCTFARELSDEDLRAFGARRRKAPPADQRTWRRFPAAVTASYEIVTAAESRPRAAQILNISPTGIGLVVQEPIAAGTLLSMELPGAGGPARRMILACAVHVTPRGDGEWALGCNFIRSLTDKDLQALV